MIYWAIGVLSGIVIYQAIEKWQDRKYYQAFIQNLLVQSMSRNVGEYAEASRRLKGKPDDPKTKEERIAEFKESFGDPNILPVN